MAIGRIVVPQGSTPLLTREAARTHQHVVGMSPAAVVARSLAMVALAVFAILVVLPAAVSAQVAIPL